MGPREVLTEDETGVIPLAMTEKEAARLLGLTPLALAGHRKRGTAPPHFNIGRAVRYRRQVVIDWIIQQEREQENAA